jgi:hypothetical protein
MKAKQKLARTVLAAGLAAGAVVVVSPAAQAGYSYRLHAGCDYARADIWLNNGTQGRAYARHGNISALSGWYNGNAWAYADTGTNCSSQAWVQWR